MPNPLELLDKSFIIKSKIDNIINSIKDDIHNGTIPNKTMAFVRLRDEVNTFILSLVKPTMQLHRAYKFPVSEDLNNMVYGAWVDINNIYQNSQYNQNVLKTTFDRMTIERNMMRNMNKQMIKKVEEIEKSIEVDEVNYTSFSEVFLNYNLVDTSFENNNTLFIDTIAGSLTLSRINAYTYNSPNIIVKENANGFPGDTHKANTVNSQIVFSGELEAHTNLNDIIDQNEDTWFEYEGITVEANDYKKTDGFGFEYKEGRSWLFTDKELILELKFEYKVPHIINYIILTPYLPNEGTYIPAMISSIKLDNGSGTVQQEELIELIDSDLKFNHEVVKIFSAQLVKSITVKIKQSDAYRLFIGHKYFIDIDPNTNLLEEIRSDGYRIEGIKPKIENLGIRYNPLTSIYDNPIMTDGYKAPESSKLFTQKDVRNDILSGTELLTGGRYIIGIRSMYSANIEFSANGEYISKPFVFENDINTLTFIPNDQWLEEEKDRWIKYSLSIDNGITWISVTTFDQDISLSNTTKSIRIKIELARPTVDSKSQYKSPVVYSYIVKGRYIS